MNETSRVCVAHRDRTGTDRQIWRFLRAVHDLKQFSDRGIDPDWDHGKIGAASRFIGQVLALLPSGL